MILSELFSHINNAYRGSDDDVPETGTADYDNWLNTTNRKIAEWSNDSNVSWRSLFGSLSAGTVTSGTQTYDLDDSFMAPADRISVTTTDGNTLEYVIAPPQERDRFSNSVYISGFNPQQLTFNDTINDDSNLVGGTINVPGYYAPDQVASSGDTIPVDDPFWLVMAVASELAFNDLTYSDKSPDINAKANDLYSGMISSNRRGTSNYPRIARTNVNRIRDTRDDLYGSGEF